MRVPGWGERRVVWGSKGCGVPGSPVCLALCLPSLPHLTTSLVGINVSILCMRKLMGKFSDLPSVMQ